MIRLLEGIVKSATDRSVIIMTSSGVGYLVAIPKPTKLTIGEPVQLFTHLAVRETALDLYGFITATELDFFELLLTIPKIGPKSALQILDLASLSLLCEAISQNDAGKLTKLSGIGKKTAEKIVQELADKITDFTLQLPNLVTKEENLRYQDAFDTLITLGYNPTNIRQVLDTIPSTEAETTTSHLVKQALQKLS